MGQTDRAYQQLWRVVDGAVRDAFRKHGDYLTPKGRHSAKRSVVKRVTGTVLSFALQEAKRQRELAVTDAPPITGEHQAAGTPPAAGIQERQGCDYGHAQKRLPRTLTRQADRYGGEAVSHVEHLGDGVEMHLGDMLEVLPTLGKVDHIIGDPPYEDELHAAVGKFASLRNDGKVYASQKLDSLGFDGVNADRARMAAVCVEASDGWLILFTLAEGVRAWRDDIQAAGAKWDTTLAWVKPDASPRFNGQGAARGFENAVTAWCGKGYRSWNGGGKRGVYTHLVNHGRQGEHPTEKPVPLMAEIIADFTKPGQLICDPFCGSGSTGVAAVRHGRRFIGIEQSQRWFDLSCRRIEAALKQGDMFIEQPKRPEQLSILDGAA